MASYTEKEERRIRGGRNRETVLSFSLLVFCVYAYTIIFKIKEKKMGKRWILSQLGTSRNLGRIQQLGSALLCFDDDDASFA